MQLAGSSFWSSPVCLQLNSRAPGGALPLLPPPAEQGRPGGCVWRLPGPCPASRDTEGTSVSQEQAAGEGRKGWSPAPGWDPMGQGVSGACVRPAGCIHAAWLPCLLLSQHQKEQQENKNKIKTNNPQVAEALEGSEGRAATCPRRQGPWLPALLLPARLSPLSLCAAVSHVRLPAHGRLAAPCRRLLLASASSPLPWQLGPASFTRSPRPAGRPPGCWGGQRWEPV